MAPPLRLAVGALAFAVASFNLLPEVLNLIGLYHDINDASKMRRSMLALPLPSFGGSVVKDDDDAKSNYEYSVLLVSYHKTGVSVKASSNRCWGIYIWVHLQCISLTTAVPFSEMKYSMICKWI